MRSHDIYWLRVQRVGHYATEQQQRVQGPEIEDLLEMPAQCQYRINNSLVTCTKLFLSDGILICKMSIDTVSLGRMY